MSGTIVTAAVPSDATNAAADEQPSPVTTPTTPSSFAVSPLSSDEPFLPQFDAAARTDVIAPHPRHALPASAETIAQLQTEIAQLYAQQPAKTLFSSLSSYLQALDDKNTISWRIKQAFKAFRAWLGDSRFEFLRKFFGDYKAKFDDRKQQRVLATKLHAELNQVPGITTDKPQITHDALLTMIQQSKITAGIPQTSAAITWDPTAIAPTPTVPTTPLFSKKVEVLIEQAVSEIPAPPHKIAPNR